MPDEQNQDNPNDNRDGSRREWSRLHLWQIQPVRDVLVVLLVLLVLWLGQKIAIVTVPVLLAILFAYLFEPVIACVMRRSSLKRRGAVTAVLIGAILLVVLPTVAGVVFGAVQGYGLFSRTRDNVELVRDSLPSDDLSEDELDGWNDRQNRFVREQAGPGWAWIRSQIAGAEDGLLSDAYNGASAWFETNQEQIAANAAAAVPGAARSVVSVAKSVASFFGGLFALGFAAFLTAFFFFFIATGWVEVKKFGMDLIPEKHKDTSVHLVTEFDRVVSAFIRGRLTIAFIQAIVFTLGYWLIGVPAAFILGPVVAILSIVPYLALVGVPVSILLLWLEAHTGIRGHWAWIVGAPVGLYFLGQALDDYVLTPLIQGKETDMSTPMILFASLAGGALFGVFGLLIAIPLAACLKIVLKEIFWPRFQAWARGEESDFLPLR